MRRVFLCAVVVCGLLGVSTESRAQSRCTRGDLQKAVDGYIAAQTKGQPSLMRLATPLTYMEQIRYVHTITICLEPGCGFTRPARGAQPAGGQPAGAPASR